VPAVVALERMLVDAGRTRADSDDRRFGESKPSGATLLQCTLVAIGPSRYFAAPQRSDAFGRIATVATWKENCTLLLVRPTL
jgi:hypothetical protein